MNLLKISPVLFSLALGACVISDGDDTDAADTGTATATMTATATATMTATDPTVTDTDPSTTDDPTTATLTTTDPDSTGADSTDADSTGADSTDSTGAETGDPGVCGWLDAEDIYDCGGVGEDPSKIFPIDCAVEPVEGDPCGADKGPITAVGCCVDANTVAYCDEDKTVFVFPCG